MCGAGVEGRQRHAGTCSCQWSSFRCGVERMRFLGWGVWKGETIAARHYSLGDETTEQRIPIFDAAYGATGGGVHGDGSLLEV